MTRLCFYQTRSAWSVDQGSNKNHSPAYNFTPTVTKFCVMWEEGLSLPHDTKFGNCRCKIVDSRAFPSWSLIHGLSWSGLIKAEPGLLITSGKLLCGDSYALPQCWILGINPQILGIAAAKSHSFAPWLMVCWFMIMGLFQCVIFNQDTNKW